MTTIASTLVTHRQPSKRRLGSLGVLIAAGCAGETPEDRPDIELKYASAHFKVGTSFSERLCAGTLNVLEKHADTLRTVFGTELSPVDIYLYDSSAPCTQADAAGCYSPDLRFIKTDWTSINHEIVHALTYQWGPADPLFTEGIAEAFDGGPSRFKDVLPSTNLGKGVDYAAARHFLRWLHASHGPERLRELFERSEPTNGGGAFQAVYGMTLAEADEKYFAEAMELYPALEECGADPTPWAGNVWSKEVDLDCESEQTWGWGHMLRGDVFEVARPGRYFLELAPRDAEALVRRCQTSEIPPGETPKSDDAGREWRTARGSEELDLDLGRYQIDVRVPAGSPVRVNVRLALDVVLQPVP